MRSRPKQVNYVAKYAAAQQVSGAPGKAAGSDALRSADRIIAKNAAAKPTEGRAPAAIPKKPAGGPSRAARPGRGQAIGKPAEAASDDEGPQGQIKQFISLDDIPDDMSSFSAAPQGSFASQQQAGGVGRAFGLGGASDEDFWAQPAPAARAAAPSSAGEHFGRAAGGGGDQTNHWGMPLMGGGGAAARMQRAVSPLVVQEVNAPRGQPHFVPPQRQPEQPQPQRRNGEFISPRAQEPVQPQQGSPRGKPAQNVIPRLTGMRPMQQAEDENYGDDDDHIGGYSVPAPSKAGPAAEDHGFSPPPKARIRLGQPQPASSFGSEVGKPSPRGEQQGVGVMRKGRPPPLPAMAGEKEKEKKRGSPRAPQGSLLPDPRKQPPMSHHQFEQDDLDEWMDEPRGSSGNGGYGGQGGYGGYSGQSGGGNYDQADTGGFSEWGQEQEPDYDDDSVDNSPRHRQKAGGKKGIPLVNNVHAKADFHNKYTGLGTKDVLEQERHERNREAGVAAIGGGGRKYGGGKKAPHVRKGAPQLVSPRSSLDEVNHNAPPLPFDREQRSSHPSAGDVPAKDKLHYSKAPRKVEYKPYTLADYKQIKGETYKEVSKLQPDLNSDVLVAKRANQQRVKDFSKQLKEFNRAEIKQAQPQAYPAAVRGAAPLASAPAPAAIISNADREKIAALNKRERALQYAKKVRSHVAAAQADQSDAAKARRASQIPRAGGAGYSEDDWHGEPDFGDDGYVVAGDASGMGYDKAREIELLESQHADGKRQIDAIKRALKL